MDFKVGGIKYIQSGVRNREIYTEQDRKRENVAHMKSNERVGDQFFEQESVGVGKSTGGGVFRKIQSKKPTI